MALRNVETHIIDSRHPNWLSNMSDWEKWRLTYRGGDEFRDKYLEQFSSRETTEDFNARKLISPIPGFAKAAINDIRNSIFQRMSDITRTGGSETYQKAIHGLAGGVDHRGFTMNAFLGVKILTDLLVMGRVGVYVDMPEIAGGTLADAQDARPYLYDYQSEDILSWSMARPEEPSEFRSLLLRDTLLNYDRRTLLPLDTFQRFRLYWIDDETGLVNLQFYDAQGNETDQNGNPAGPITLELNRIPFVLFDIGDSLLKEVCSYQIALLNLVSSDVNYALKANFPFYVEQRDMRAVGGHLKPAANADGAATADGQGGQDTDIKVGTTQGRYYDLKAEAPQFIAPPSDPLRTSMLLQEKLEGDIRKLVNLAVKTLAQRASAESKEMDNQGLEAGLSYIGLVLESGEKRIADFWAAYEDREPRRRKIATIKYPTRYELKSDKERIEEADKLSELMRKIPGRTIKRELAKEMASKLLGGRVSMDRLNEIHREIEVSPYTTSDPKVIVEAKNAGLVGEQTASQALGFDDDEYLTAREDHVERVKRLAEAQIQNNPAARGVPDLADDPNGGKDEKELSRNTDLRESTEDRTRGEGREN